MLQLKQRMAQVHAFPVVLNPAWKFALVTYLVARLALTVWSLVIFSFFPMALKNLDLFGAPVLAAFDLASSERYAYSRQVADPATPSGVDGVTLTFRAGTSGYIVDTQTESVWSLREGRAITGRYAGRGLVASAYSVDDIFPYLDAVVETNPLVALWQRFDTNWYLAIAARGYAPDGSTVYFPLYPALIRVATVLVGDPLLAALLISNLALIGALVLLYWLGERFFDAASARRAVAYLLLFPTGFFLLVAYTESLFLLFTLGAFVFAARGRWRLAAMCGALTALTRLQGVLLIVPLGYLWWKEVSRSAEQGNMGMPITSSPHHASRITHYVLHGSALLLIPLASVLFLALTNLSLLTAYEGQLHAQFVWPWENVGAAVALLASGRGSLIDALNLLVTLGFGTMTFTIWRQLPREYGLYAVAMFLAPLFRMTTTQPLVSMMRYALVVFPVFVLWGVWGRNTWVNRAVVYLSFPLQLYSSAQFVMWGWVG